MRTIRKKSHEKLDDANLKRVFDLLNDDNPITKKEACGMLNITYNTTRLNSIMKDFDETMQYREKRKSQNRGKKATDYEIKQAIEGFMLELVGQRALYDFLVVCDDTNNTPTRIDRNELYVDIAVEPVKSVEFIYIPLRIKNTGEIAKLGQ